MKIVDVSTKIVNISLYSNWIFIFVQTDQGITGVGEATLDGLEVEVIEMVRQMSQVLVGNDPMKNIIPRRQFPDMAYAAASSGLDMALWDIRGKYANKPVYELLGLPVRLEIPVYATFNRALKSRNPLAFSEMARHVVEVLGFTGLKCAPFDESVSAVNSDIKDFNPGIQRIAAIRGSVGSKPKLMVDCHWRFDLQDAIRVAERVRPYDIFWLEAPVSEKDVHLVRQAREMSGLRVAGFEMQTDLNLLKPFLEKDALDFYMPDVKYIGGITALVEANELIQAKGRMIAPHNMTGPVATLASMHASVTFENLIYLEMHVDEAEFVPSLSDFDFALSNGEYSLPKKPGLGIQMNMTELDRHPYQSTQPFRPKMLGDFQ